MKNIIATLEDEFNNDLKSKGLEPFKFVKNRDLSIYDLPDVLTKENIKDVDLIIDVVQNQRLSHIVSLFKKHIRNVEKSEKNINNSTN